jgi:hypothetical protein
MSTAKRIVGWLYMGHIYRQYGSREDSSTEALSRVPSGPEGTVLMETSCSAVADLMVRPWLRFRPIHGKSAVAVGGLDTPAPAFDDGLSASLEWFEWCVYHDSCPLEEIFSSLNSLAKSKMNGLRDTGK